MKKKIVLIVVFLIVIVGSAFSLGVADVKFDEGVVEKTYFSKVWEAITESIENEMLESDVLEKYLYSGLGGDGIITDLEEAEILVKTDHYFGESSVYITSKLKSDEKLYIIEKQGDKAYLLTDDGNVEFEKPFGFFEDDISYELIDEPVDEIMIKRLALGVSSMSEFETGLGSYAHKKNHVKKFTVKHWGAEERKYLIVFINDVGQIYFEYLDLILFHEFLEGEKELITGATYWDVEYTGDETADEKFIYAAKASELVRNHITFNRETGEISNGNKDWWNSKISYTGITDDYKVTANEESIVQSNEAGIHSLSYSSALKDMVSRNILVRTDKNDFDGLGVSLPYLDYTSDTFDAIYGKMVRLSFANSLFLERNSYLAPYLNYLYQEAEKPLLSNLFRKNEYYGHLDLYYDYNDYTKIETNPNDEENIVDEGEKLAEAALRYLTWGVEYSPYNVANKYGVAYYPNEVFKENRSRIENWVNGTADESRRFYNYFPKSVPDTSFEFTSEDFQEKTNTPYASNIHIIEEDLWGIDQLTLYAHKDPAKNVVLNKVDFWSARNILWENQAVESFELADGGVLVESDKFIDKDNQTPGVIGVLSGENALITKLYSPQSIGGILVMGDQLNTGNVIRLEKEGDALYRNIYEYSTFEATEITDLLRGQKGGLITGQFLDSTGKVVAGETGHPVKNVFDGNENTYGGTEFKERQEMILDLGEDRDIQTLRMRFANAGGKDIKAELEIHVKGENDSEYESITNYFAADFSVYPHGKARDDLYPDPLRKTIKVNNYDDILVTLRERRQIRYIKIEDVTNYYGMENQYPGFEIFEVDLYKGAFASKEQIAFQQKYEVIGDPPPKPEKIKDEILLGLRKQYSSSSINSENYPMKTTVSGTLGEDNTDMKTYHGYYAFDGDPDQPWRSTSLFSQDSRRSSLLLDLNSAQNVKTVRVLFNFSYGDFQIRVKKAVDDDWTYISRNSVGGINSYSGGVKTELTFNSELNSVHLPNYEVGEDLWITFNTVQEIRFIEIVDVTHEAGNVRTTGTDDKNWATWYFGIKEIYLYEQSYTGLRDVAAEKAEYDRALKAHEQGGPKVDRLYYDEIFVDNDDKNYCFRDKDSLNQDDVSNYNYYIFRNIVDNVSEIYFPLSGSSSQKSVSEYLVFDQNPLAHVIKTKGSRKRVNIFTDLLKTHIEGITTENDSNTITMANGNTFKAGGADAYIEEHAAGLLLANNGTTHKEYWGFAPVVNSTIRVLFSEMKEDATVVFKGSDNFFEIWEGNSHTGVPSSYDKLEWLWGRSYNGVEGFVKVGGVSGIFDHDFDQKVKRDIFALTFNFKNSIDIKTVVLWENKNTNALTSNIQFAVNGRDHYLKYFIDTKPLTDFVDKFQLTTPFRTVVKEGNTFVSKRILGNPLPYAPMGIDSPRTFAYKMLEQNLAKALIVDHVRNAQENSSFDNLLGLYYDLIIDNYSSESITTKAIDSTGFENYKNSYISEIDMAKILLNVDLTINHSTGGYNEEYALEEQLPYNMKPFLPNFYLNNRSGMVQYVDEQYTQSVYNPDKVAGVDSVGLLSGAIAMADIDVRDAFNRPMSDRMDKYIQMKADPDLKVKGLDPQGKPVFYATNRNSFLQGAYRFDRTDIERSTVLVPDISYIEVGDLLVRYDVEGEPHIGIVVRLDWEHTNDPENQPEYGDGADEWWEQVWVVSVRRGFQAVALGTWGSSGNTFNSFTDSPRSYQIRRLLKEKEDNFIDGRTVRKEAEPWELVDEIKVRNLYTYPPQTQLPWYSRTYLYTDQQEKFVEHVKDFEYPDPGIWWKWNIDPVPARFYKEWPPSSYLNLASHRFLDDDITDDKHHDIRITSLGSWRYLAAQGFGGYHTGVDMVDTTSSIFDIRAPESGYLWFVVFDDNHYNVKLPGEHGILNEVSTFNQEFFGFLAVLIATDNLNDIEDSRIYVFAHLGQKGLSTDDAILKLKQDFITNNSGLTVDDIPVLKYYTDEDSGKSYKPKPTNTLKISAGDWLAKMSNRGTISAHVHLEVFEHFPNIEKADNDPADHVSNWRRVNPLSVFPQEWFSIEDKDELYQELETLQNEFGDDNKAFFKEWNKF